MGNADRRASKRRTKSEPITQRPATGVKKLPSGPTLIRSFHRLQNTLQNALAAGDRTECDRLEKEIEALGGLAQYQKASIRGQDKRRGGDSSRLLVDWLRGHRDDFGGREKTRVLEIGCLSPDNFISRDKTCEVTRIDLHSQHPQILQQDFLDRPAPSTPEEGFDGISLSLVLNFVPLTRRSDFLLHVIKFLPVAEKGLAKWLFLVLPAPCIQNSRYMDKALLLEMMDKLGFEVVEEKITDRIVYWLLKRAKEVESGVNYKKREIRTGSTRNNFWIPLST